MRRVLTKVREINDAVWEATNGRAPYVYCVVEDEIYRIVRARTVKGVLQVRRLCDWKWVVPGSVWAGW